MRLKVVMVAAALVAGVPVLAHGAAPRSHAAARAAWGQRHAALARTLPVDEAVLDAAHRFAVGEEDSEDFAYLVQAGDLDGDGGTDLVDIRDRYSYDDIGVHETVRLEAHRGRDGKLLWSVAIPQAEYVYPVFTGVGANGKPGVIVVAYNSLGRDAMVAGAGEVEANVSAYDGAGKSLWTKKVVGAIAASEVTYNDANAAAVAGIGRFVKGGGSDVLLQTWETVAANDPTYTVEQTRTRLRLSVVDGATGVEKPLGTGLVSESFETYAVALGDIDKDGLDDAVVVGRTAGKRDATFVRASDGGTISKPAGLPASGMWQFEALPDVTGDGAADVALTDAGGFIVEGPGGASSPQSGSKVTLVDAAKGRVAWTRTGDAVFPIGNADRKPGTEVVVTNRIYSGAVGFSATAVTGSGRALWSASRTLKTSDFGRYEYESSWGGVGDVHGDGIVDIGYALAVTPYGARGRHDEGTINGRNGRVTRDPVADLRGTTLSFDGHGSDSYQRNLKNHIASVTTWSGDRPRRLWQVSFVAGDWLTRTFATNADKDRCAELVFATATDDNAYTDVVLSGKNGRPLWSVSRHGDAAPVLVRTSVRASRQFARTC